MKQKLTVLFATLATIQMLSMACFGQSSGGGRLAGTWDAAVQITDCATGTPIPSIPSFKSTAAFNQGGTFVGITGGTAPSERSAEIGVWKHLEGDRYQFRFKAYRTAPGGGLPAFYEIVTHEIELNQDNLTYASSGTAARYTMAGIQIFSGCSTSAGTRMTID